MSVAVTSQPLAPPKPETTSAQTSAKSKPVPLGTIEIADKLAAEGRAKVAAAKLVLAEGGTFRSIPLAQIVPSKTNPRKSFDGPELDELTASVKQHGILQPILVRSGWQQLKSTTEQFEIVAGERRFRAAKAAGLQELPCIVRAISDVEALEMQIVENLQRQDVKPLEEAEGFVALAAELTKEGSRLVSVLAGDAKAEPTSRQAIVEKIAARVGKSTRYVYARMKLVELVPEVKAAVVSGKIEASHADLIVALPAAEQKEALDICFTWGEDDKGEYREGVRLRSVREFKQELDDVKQREKLQTERKAAAKLQRSKLKDRGMSASNAASRAKQQKAEEKAKLDRETQKAASVAVFEAAIGKVKDLTGAVLDMLIEQEFRVGDAGDEQMVAKQVGWTIKGDAHYGQLEELFQANRAKMTATQKAQLFVAQRLGVEVEWGEKQLDDAAKALKVDTKKVRAAAAAKFLAAQKDAAKAAAAVTPTTTKSKAKKAGRK